MVRKPLPDVVEDFTTAASHARSALNLLTELRIPPNPERFHVAFVHQTSSNQALSMAMNRMLSHDKLSVTALDELYDQFFARLIGEAELRDASMRIERTVSDVVECIDAASESAEHYGTVLADFSGAAPQSDFDKRVDAILDETRQMATSNRRLEERLQSSSTEIEFLRQHLERLEREASLDNLTGIANRKRFDQLLRDAMARSQTNGTPLCLLMIDIDFFKTFNDTHGHLLGDQVLKLVARYMGECVTAQDTVARYGGEEFVTILPRSSLEQAVTVAETIRQHVGSKNVVNRRTGASLGKIALSIGVAEYRRGEPAAELIHRADEALYLAKGQGRNRVKAETDLP